MGVPKVGGDSAGQSSRTPEPKDHVGASFWVDSVRIKMALRKRAKAGGASASEAFFRVPLGNTVKRSKPPESPLKRMKIPFIFRFALTAIIVALVLLYEQ